jgi:hypothetical protein
MSKIITRQFNHTKLAGDWSIKGQLFDLSVNTKLHHCKTDKKFLRYKRPLFEDLKAVKVLKMKLALAIFALLVLFQLAVSQQCGRNEIWKECGKPHSCELDCQDVLDNNNRICLPMCVEAGCFCDGGFVRRHRDADRSCVSRAECRP